jgi:hypothetical protein
MRQESRQAQDAEDDHVLVGDEVAWQDTFLVEW